MTDDDAWRTKLLLARREGLLLGPCHAVHMLGMRFPLDVLLLDRSGTVTALYAGLAPGRRTRWHREAVWALEMRTATIDASGTTIGDTIDWRQA